MTQENIVVYQIFTRLFGNTKTLNKPWGTKEENGVGKFSDFTDKALTEIKKMGVTHIWYTGVLHHALIGNYSQYGISPDHPKVVKGRAGSPYAVKDYYSVNPDLADDPANRLDEFKKLIERTHKNGLKVIIDIVPNHVARNYKSIEKPKDIIDFGEDDNTKVVYDVNNNFYYNPNEAFTPPTPPLGHEPLGGEIPPVPLGEFHEFPAKWTGNGSRSSTPDFNDWYETAKLNFGIRPDGQKDFPELPRELEYQNYQVHYEFWKDKTLPDTWLKFRDIALYWLAMGVDGFRYDMAELVPVEFWSFLNSSILIQNPKAFLLAEVYNPSDYRSYIHQGKMVYLYDKVQMYDTLRDIIQHGASTGPIVHIEQELSDIGEHMLLFLENHDEQRIASPEFANQPEKAMPAMVLCKTIREAPLMIYFGQEVGEPAMEKAGFAGSSRTSIFDYISVPYFQRWVNKGKFDGEYLNYREKQLRDFYIKLLHLQVEGTYYDIHHHNRKHSPYYNEHLYSFVRGNKDSQWLIVCNFTTHHTYGFDLEIPHFIIEKWELPPKEYTLEDQLYKHTNTLKVEGGLGKCRIEIKPLQSFVYLIK